MNVKYLDVCDGNGARDLGARMDTGEVTHAVITFECEDGSVWLSYIGGDDWTKLMGLVERARDEMCYLNRYGAPE